MSVHELVSAETWLYGVLSNDTTLLGYAPGGVFADLAPDGTLTPYVIFNAQSPGVNSLTMNGVRLLSNPLYQVVATGPASQMSSIANAAAEIDKLLKPPASGTVAGGYISSSYQETPLMLSQVINTVKWKSIGGLYRLSVQQTS